MAVSASADDLQCGAAGERFAIGRYACLTVGGQSHLARCETNLDIPTWTKMLDICPGGPPAAVAASFQCRVDGRYVPAGGYACLSVSGKQQLARCDAVLNSPSWTVVQQGCPGGPLPEAASAPESGSALKDALALPRRLLDSLMDQM